MTDIVLTHAHMRKLAAAISKVDGRTLRHYQRIDLIAEVFGWKGDALMHFLKGRAGSPGREATDNAIHASPIGPGKRQVWEHFIDNDSLGQAFELKGAISKRGIVVIAGPQGSGKSTTAAAAARYLQVSTVQPIYGVMEVNEIASGQALKRGVIVIEDGADDLNLWQKMCDATRKGHLVLTTVDTSSVYTALHKLKRLGATDPDLQCVSGGITQRLLYIRGTQQLLYHDLAFDARNDVLTFLTTGDGIAERKITEKVNLIYALS